MPLDRKLIGVLFELSVAALIYFTLKSGRINIINLNLERKSDPYRFFIVVAILIAFLLAGILELFGIHVPMPETSWDALSGELSGNR